MGLLDKFRTAVLEPAGITLDSATGGLTQDLTARPLPVPLPVDDTDLTVTNSALPYGPYSGKPLVTLDEYQNMDRHERYERFGSIPFSPEAYASEMTPEAYLYASTEYGQAFGTKIGLSEPFKFVKDNIYTIGGVIVGGLAFYGAVVSGWLSGAGAAPVAGETAGEAGVFVGGETSGVSLVGGPYLLEGPTTFGPIAEGAGATAVESGGIFGGWKTLEAAAIGAGAAIFQGAKDIGQSVLESEVTKEITKEVQSLFGGSTLPQPDEQSYEQPGFFASLGSALPIGLIILTLVGAFLLIRKRRK